jgi:hypothetical protein
MRPILVVVALETAAVLAFAPGRARSGDAFADLAVEQLAEPRPAATLSLPALGGGTVKVPDEFRGKVVLLGFFTTT